MALPQGTIANAEIMAILLLVDQPQAFSARLLDLAAQVRLDGRNRLNAFLERLLDYTGKEIAPESIPSILLSLLDVGDQLLEPEDMPMGRLHIGNDQRIAQIIWQLLQRLPAETRFDVLRQAITKGRAVYTSTRLVMVLGKLDAKPAGEGRPEANKLIRHNDQVSLEAMVLAKVRDAAQGESLLNCPKLPNLLSMWKDLAGEAEPKDWVTKVANDDGNLVKLLEQFLEKDFSHTMIKAGDGRQYHLNHKALEPFLAAGSMLDRSRSLAQRLQLSKLQQDALRQFIEAGETRGHQKSFQN